MGQALLYSGGLDCYCLNKLERPDTLVVVDPGTEEAAQERSLIQATVDEYERVNMPFLAEFEEEDKVIPFRNTFFALAGAQYENTVLLGATLGDGITPDTTYQWASAVEATLNVFGGPFDSYSVSLPGRELSKGQLVKSVMDMRNIHYEQILTETRSCHYGDNSKGCGECFDCLARFVSFGWIDDVDIEVLFRYFDSDPILLFEANRQKVVDNFARRYDIYEHFLDTMDRCGYRKSSIPDPSPFAREEV